MTNQILGRTEMALGDLPAARGHLETAVGAERLSGAVYLLSWHLAHLGTLERVDGNLAAAHGYAEEALEVARRLGSGWMQANAERLLGRLALTAGEATEAERYVHDALGRLVAKGFALDVPEFWVGVERTTRDALGPDSYDAAFAAGAALGTAEAVASVRRTRDQRK